MQGPFPVILSHLLHARCIGFLFQYFLDSDLNSYAQMHFEDHLYDN